MKLPKKYLIGASNTIKVSTAMKIKLNNRVRKECRPIQEIVDEILSAVLDERWEIPRPTLTPQPKPKKPTNPYVVINAESRDLTLLRISVKTIMEYHRLSMAGLAYKVNTSYMRIKEIVQREEKGYYSYANKKLGKALRQLWNQIPAEARKGVWDEESK